MQNVNKLASVLRGLNVRLFEQRTYSSKKRDAQMNLEGRTHYCEDGTLRYFHARIVGCTDMQNGTLLCVTESVSADYQNTRRGFRCVVFDVWGTVVYRPELSDLSGTSDKAKKAMYQWLDSFDTVDHYRNAIAEKASRARREHEELRAAYNETFEG